MANLFISTLCLVAVCSLPGGDSANLSLRRRPLDGSPGSADHAVRVARSLLAARVIDHHGNPVTLRSTGHPGSRRVVNPFVTSHGRVTSQRRVTSHGQQQWTQTSGGRRRNYGRNQIHTRTISAAPARHSSGPSSFRRTNQSPRQNTFSRRTNQSPWQNAISGQTFQSKPFTYHRSADSSGRAHNSHSSTVYQQTRGSNSIIHHPSSSSSSSSSQAASQTSSPESDIGKSVYSHGLEPHMPLNARDMATFLIQRSTRPRQYVDRTKGIGTLHSSRPGQCPVVDQSRCAPLPMGPLAPSCGNDYQCTGQQSKCCYDPCLTFSKCVQPVND